MHCTLSYCQQHAYQVWNGLDLWWQSYAATTANDDTEIFPYFPYHHTIFPSPIPPQREKKNTERLNSTHNYFYNYLFSNKIKYSLILPSCYSYRGSNPVRNKTIVSFSKELYTQSVLLCQTLPELYGTSMAKWLRSMTLNHLPLPFLLSSWESIKNKQKQIFFLSVKIIFSFLNTIVYCVNECHVFTYINNKCLWNM